MINFAISELSLEDLHPELLKDFNRYQEVKRCWRFEDGVWVLKDVPFTEQWDDDLKREIVAVDFTKCLQSGGVVWGVFDRDSKLIAFACLLSEFWGSEGQYLQLSQLHVSCEYRGRGVGKELFRCVAQRAKSMGAQKLYISAHSSEESCYFYTNLGCVDALEVNKKIAELEPYDRQLEFCLGG